MKKQKIAGGGAGQSDFKMLLHQPVLLATILLVLLALVIFVLLPIANVLRLSVTAQQGGFTMDNFIKVIENKGYRTTFFNSLKLGVVVAVFSTFLGYVFAFAVTRTELPGKVFFKMIAQLPVVSPPFILSLAIIFLFGKQGLITNKLFGIKGFDVYGFPSLVIVQVISFFPIAYMSLCGIMESIDTSVEDAAYNMGASRWHIFRTITLPLSVPGIASALLLTFILSLEDFSNPAVIAGSFSTLAVEAYHVITGTYNLPGGAVMSILLMLPTFTAFFLQKYWLADKSFVTVTGKPTQARRKLHEKHIIYPLFLFCGLITLFTITLYGTVLVGAFVKVWGINFSFTLDHFKFIFGFGKKAMSKSIMLAVIAAPICGILGIGIAYLTTRQKFLGRKMMEFSSLLCFAIPGTVLGIGYVSTFNKPPLLLTGTAFILVAVFVFRNIPVAIESGQATLLQIDPSIEEAATILGADSGKVFRSITLPLLKQPFFSGIVYSFVRSMTAVSTVIFLISPNWSLATSSIFSLFEASKYSAAAAFVIWLIVVLFFAIGVISLVVKLVLSPRRGSASTRALKKLQVQGGNS